MSEKSEEYKSESSEKILKESENVTSTSLMDK